MNIADYWIKELRNTREFEALANLEDKELSLLEELMRQAMDDQFIQTAHETGIARREKILEIAPFADDTLESRRFKVQALWNGKLPYTYRILVEKLNELCGEGNYVLQLNHAGYSLLIRLELTARRMFDSVSENARAMIPANLVLTVELRYRQHLELRQYTHAQLSQWTHRELREGELT